MTARNAKINILIAVLATALFIPGIGGVRLFDWDEINFAESAREMVVTGDWFNVQINYKSFWEKPPLFIWMQALSMKVFGINEFSARFPNAVMGILTVLLLFNIGRKTKDERFGLLWAGMYAMSFLSFFYFKSGIIDPWFNFFIFLSIYFFSRYTNPDDADRRMLFASLSAAASGLAILTKGPVGLLIFGLTFFFWLLSVKFKLAFRWKDVAAYLIVLCLVGGSWFIALALTGHAEVINDFIEYQIRLFETKDAGHGGFLLYHFVILLFGMVPASIFALQTFRRRILDSEENVRLAGLFRWMMTSFWVVLILFTIVRTKIVHYSSFCYFPLSFLAAYAADRMLDGKMTFKGWQKGLLIGISTLLGIIFILLTFFDKLKEKIVPLIDDPFTVKCMEAESDWVGFEPLVGIALIICTVTFCILFSRRKSAHDFYILVAGNIFFTFTAMLCAVGEVEKYSQDSVIDFCMERRGEDCYICPFNIKSFAQYFYADRQPENTLEDFNVLKDCKLDKPCYFFMRDTPDDIQEFTESVTDAEMLYRRTGFIFFVRR